MVRRASHHHTEGRSATDGPLALSREGLVGVLSTFGPPRAVLERAPDRELRAALRAMATGGDAHDDGCTAVATQLGFEDVAGFGLDGLEADLRAFDALRPSGNRAMQAPGCWPVRALVRPSIRPGE